LVDELANALATMLPGVPAKLKVCLGLFPTAEDAWLKYHEARTGVT
jgi:hypothetical protein